MPLTPGFPTSMTEYITVWCADLLEPLTAAQRESFVRGAEMMYEGGPWHSRLAIQRLVEYYLTPDLDADTHFGELLEHNAGGVAGAIERLRAPYPDSRAAAVDQLHLLPGTPELVDAVNTATADGTLTDAERQSILTSALSRRILPEPIPNPPEYPPIPADHPESYAERLERDPPYEEIPLTDGPYLDRPGCARQ